VDDCIFGELDKPITVKEIECVINKLKSKKAFGGDSLINEYFIATVDILGAHLAGIFNGILITGFFSKQWMEGLIVLLHKKNYCNDVNNYRGITLISCFAKIFTGIINKRLG